MAYTAKAMISVEITIDGVTHVIAEGDKVRNLVYTENGVTHEIDEGEAIPFKQKDVPWMRIRMEEAVFEDLGEQ